MCPISTGCHMDQITPQVDLPVQAVPDTTGTAPALNLKRRPNLYRERHCIWFSYPLELPGIIRSYESYVIYIFWKKTRRPFSIHPLWLITWRNSIIWESHISFKKKGIVELFFVQPVKSTPHCSWLSLGCPLWFSRILRINETFTGFPMPQFYLNLWWFRSIFRLLKCMLAKIENFNDLTW